MSKYIDADSYRKKWADVFDSAYGDSCCEMFKDSIDTQPTADVVEVARCLSLEEAEPILEEHNFVKVTRCKDCIHGIKDFDKFLCEWNQEFHDGDWFCADGERREDGR